MRSQQVEGGAAMGSIVAKGKLVWETPRVAREGVLTSRERLAMEVFPGRFLE
jgi:hypothetical protein